MVILITSLDLSYNVLSDILGSLYVKKLNSINTIEEKTSNISNEVLAFIELFNQLYLKNNKALDVLREKQENFERGGLCIELGFNSIADTLKIGRLSCVHNNFYETKIKTAKVYKKIGSQFWVKSLWKLIFHYIDKHGLDQFDTRMTPSFSTYVEPKPEPEPHEDDVCDNCNHPTEDCECLYCPICNSNIEDSCGHEVGSEYDGFWLTDEMDLSHIDVNTLVDTAYENCTVEHGYYWSESIFADIEDGYLNILNELEDNYKIDIDVEIFDFTGDDENCEYLDVLYGALTKFKALKPKDIYKIVLDQIEIEEMDSDLKSKMNTFLNKGRYTGLDERVIILLNDLESNPDESESESVSMADYIRIIRFMMFMRIGKGY